MSDFLISALAGLDPYVPGEQPQGREYIKLNTNESPFPPSPRVLDALSREEVSRLNLYSDPTALPLRRAIADTYGLSRARCGRSSPGARASPRSRSLSATARTRCWGSVSSLSRTESIPSPSLR